MAHIKRIRAGTTAQRTAWTPVAGELFVDTDLLTAGAATALFSGGATNPAGGTAVAPASAVATVHGRTGAVIAVDGDYTASNITNVPAGNLAGVTVQTALDELQTELDGLTSITANDFLSGDGDPAAALGSDGQGYINRLTGAIWTKGAGTWTDTGNNAYSQLGLTALAGAAPTAAGSAGAGTLASREDHTHRFQTAAETAVTAITGLTATDTQAALAELQGDIDTLNTNTAGLTGLLVADIALNTAARHAHTATPLAVLETLGNPVVGDVGKSVKVTAAGTFGLVTDTDDFTALTTVTTHDGAADFVVLQTVAGARKILINDLMNAN